MQGVALPLALSLVLTGLFRLVGGPRVGPHLTALSVLVSFLVCYALISGVPPFPPRASSGKVFYVALLGGAAGLTLQALRDASRPAQVVCVAAPLLVAAWLGWPLTRSVGGVAWLMLAGAAAWGVVALWRLNSEQGRGVVPAVMLLAGALAIAGIAWFGATLSAALYAAALAAALGGYLLWNWPTARFPASEVVTLGAGVTLAGVVALLVFYTTASRLALALALGVFFAAPLARRVAGRQFRGRRALEPVIVALVAAPVVLASVTVAWIVADRGGAGY